MVGFFSGAGVSSGFACGAVRGIGTLATVAGSLAFAGAAALAGVSAAVAGGVVSRGSAPGAFSTRGRAPGADAGHLITTVVVEPALRRKLRNEYRVHAAINAGTRRNRRNTAGNVVGHFVLLLPTVIEHRVGNRFIELISGACALRIERERPAQSHRVPPRQKRTACRKPQPSVRGASR